MQKTFKHFMEDIRDPVKYEKFGSSFVMITPGRWDYLVNWLKTLEDEGGYTTNYEEIRDILQLEKHSNLLEILKSIPRLEKWTRLENL